MRKAYLSKCDIYDIFCAVLYLLKEGYTWRTIPHDYPNWQNVRYHYDIWAKPDENGVRLFDRILQKLVEMEQQENERSDHTTGIKLHIGVDVLGLPHAIMVTTADVTDRNGVIDMVNYYYEVTNHLSEIKKLLVDSGYTG